MKLMDRYRCNEAYHAEKDGKEFQVGLRFEDGTASYPKKCTVIIDGNKETVDIGEGDDRIKKAVKAGAEKLGYKIVESRKSESMEGWDDWEEIEGLEDALYNIEDLAYELRSCVRGANTNCKTWTELSKYVVSLADTLRGAGEDLKYKQDEEDESRKSEERMSYAELKADALKRIGEGPFADEDDLDDSIMSTLDAMPYDIPEGVKQSLGSDLFEILYDKIAD